jgi:hypothetical protein
MFIISMPLIVLSISSFFETHKSEFTNCGHGGHFCLGEFIVHFCQLITLAPGLASMIGGIVMMVKGSKWESQKPQETIFTLKSISPMINPITKTYGISMGFSF